MSSVLTKLKISIWSGKKIAQQKEYNKNPDPSVINPKKRYYLRSHIMNTI